jgi:glyoxylase-like metal-dependent hydrolase (beta-lactamase superfamily II)
VLRTQENDYWELHLAIKRQNNKKMNKTVKRSIWGLGILVGLVVIAATVFLIRFMLATSSMTPGETSAVNDSLFCVKDRFVNAFLFKGKQHYLMVDAGYGEKSFLSGLTQLGITPDQITTILLTHTDGDHIGAMGLFNHPKVYLYKEEEQMINGQTAKVGPFKTHWKYGPYSLLNDGDSLTVDGIKIKVIHMPGHTPGSLCYIINDIYLVTGDNLIVKDGKAAPFVEQFNMNTAQQIESLKKLPDLQRFKYILTAHHGITIH